LRWDSCGAHRIELGELLIKRTDSFTRGERLELGAKIGIYRR
jgi:hypothetical protein